jgi:hypothetical protein
LGIHAENQAETGSYSIRKMRHGQHPDRHGSNQCQQVLDIKLGEGKANEKNAEFSALDT